MAKLTRVRDSYVTIKSALAGAIERLFADKAEDIKTGLISAWYEVKNPLMDYKL